MAGRRLLLIAWLLVAAGCERAETLRQGVLSNYTRELHQLATEINRQELAKITAPDEGATAEGPSSESATVKQAQHWHAAPLLDDVQLRPPVPLNGPASQEP